MSADLTRLRINVFAAVFLLGLTLLLRASCADGQVETDATSGRAKRVKSSVPAVNTSAGSVEERLTTPKPVVVPGQSDAAVVGDNNGDDRDNVEGEQEAEEEKEEEQEYEQNKDEIVKPSTRRPPASVVTAPLPGIPLETVFKAASEPTEAPCVAIKAGIRFTFGYLNVSSGKVEKGIIDLPSRNYSIEGDCGKTRQRMSLIFSPDRQVSPESAVDAGTAWNLTLTFVRNGSEIFADRMSLRYVVKTGYLPFPWSVDAAMTAVMLKPGLFRTPDEEHSFICMSDAGFGDFVIVTDDVAAGLGGASVAAATPSSAGSKAGDSSLLQPLAVADGASNVNQSVHLQLVEFYNLQLQAFLKQPQQSSPSEAGSQSTAVSFSSQVIQCSGDYISVKVPLVLGIILLVFSVAVVTVYMTRRLMHGKQQEEKRKSVDYRAVH